MSQSSLDFNQFRTAYEMSKSGDGKILEDNFLLELIQTFAQEKRVLAFKSDLRIETGNFDSTLNDVAKIEECEKELTLFISVLSELQSKFTAKKHEIINEHIASGVLEEGLFRLELKTKHENGSLNEKKYLEHYPQVWNNLKKKALEKIEKTFKPTLGDTRKELAKLGADPGKLIVIGYELKPIMPGKAAEVETWL